MSWRNGLVAMLLITNVSFAQNRDIDLLRRINVGRNTSFDNPFIILDKTVAPVTFATPVTMFAIGLVEKDSALKHLGLYIAVSVAGNAAATTLIKYAVNRTRPYDAYNNIDNPFRAHSASFPSGHTANAFALATSLTLATKKWYVAVPSYCYAATVAYSRLHLGVHYPTDVLAGAILGSGSAIFCYQADKWIHRKRLGRNRNLTSH
jgi:membrane-associated phospholipid phosphatase